MNDFSRDFDQMTPLQRATAALKVMRAKLDALKSSRNEPLAIIGLGCRFPGGKDPDSFWETLRQGVDTITEVPAERWDVDAFYDPDPEAVGKMSTRYGGFVEHADLFDPEFFGISPREAVSMDPQQRLLLEVSWEALEHAGQSAERLQGSQTGVFVGIGSFDYGELLLAQGVEAIEPYMGTGNSHSVAAGRLSYLLGLEGPSLAVDTACSASLVAVHLACQSLRRDECTLALAAGVNMMLSPSPTINFSKARMLSPDGRCKTFAAAADGYVRSEGCGVVLLKRLSTALADGDRVLAVVRGSAVNQDGRSSGLTVPSGPSQVAVLRAALADAGLDPGEIDYVEAHGTGTKLGDPIELEALAEVFAPDRPSQRPLRIGSVKSNIGHLEAAAGIAGLIKMVLALERGELPPHLHFKAPNPQFPWERMPIEVLTERRAWADVTPRRAGVSSFGFSGTNAHVVLEAAPALPQASGETRRGPHLLCLSARSDRALAELAARYARRCAGDPPALADIAFTAHCGRSHLGHRLALVAESAAEAGERLAAFAAHGEAPGVRRGAVQPRRGKVAFLFTGQGPQQSGMGWTLYEHEPVFRRALERCDEILQPELEAPLLTKIYSDADPSPLAQTVWAQPALFALSYALSELWRSWGVVPDAVLGHSVGEYAAACVAGALSLADALRLVAARGRLMQDLCRPGRMAVVFDDPGRVAERLLPYAGEAVIASFNGPRNTVVSGTAAAIDALVAECAAAGIETRPLSDTYAFHSPLMEPMLQELERRAAGIEPHPPSIALVSNVSGRAFTGAELPDAHYWRRQACEPVRFAEGMRTLEELGATVFIELGPSATLLGMGRHCVAGEAAWLPSLRKGRDDLAQILDSLGAFYTAGGDVEWPGFHQRRPGRRTVLPTYPFERQRYWLANGAGRRAPALQRAQLPVADFLTAPGDVAERLRGLCETLPAEHHMERYEEQLLPELERLCGSYVALAFERLGWRSAPGDIVVPALLAEELGVVKRHHRLLERLLEILGEDGFLQPAEKGWQVVRHLTVEDPEPQLEALRDRHPIFPSELSLFSRCARLLPEVLRGERDPLPLIFPQQGTAGIEKIYHESAEYAVLNTLAARAVAAAVEGLGAGRTLRLLEIGAGTGGTTAHVLQALPAGQTEYVFTDIGAMLVAKAEERFRAYPFVRYQVLNIEQDPLTQGLHPHGFDLVLAANVLHATRDLRTTLGHVRRLLAPEGLLVLLENVARLRWGDLTFGMLEGWWRFEDTDLRPVHPLLGRRQWKELLAELGFTEVEGLPPEGAQRQAIAHNVIFLARLPASAMAETLESPAVLPASPAGPARPAAAVDEGRLLRRLKEGRPEERDEIVLAHVEEEICRALGLDPTHPPHRQTGFFDLGMDSLMAVEVRQRLQRDLGSAHSLSSTVAFDHPTIEALARHLRDLLAETAVGSTSRRPGNDEPIAVVGLGCRFPGGRDPQAFWELLAKGGEAVVEVPPERWNVDDFYDPDPDTPGKMYTRHGGFLESVDGFDAGFFGVSPREAVDLDPQQRLLLEVGWETLEHAGQAADQLMGSRTGVFVGICTGDYVQLELQKGLEHVGTYLSTGGAHSTAAGRLSYFFGFKGPAISVDTACSSSLVALHMACRSLREGECDLALAAGVNVILIPHLYVSFCKARMLAADGRCKTFAAAADGFVRGEGCGMVALKRLSAALDEGDRVLAVIRGSAVNQDGRSGGLTVPNGPSQVAVIREALDVGGLDPSEVDYVEAHGTGTELGDPIEVQALGEVFGPDRPVDRPLLVGSVKTNVGHLEGAAGIAGVIKVVLSFQHGEIPPHLHFDEPNPHIPWQDLPISVVTEKVPWPSGNGRRTASVSSFGFSGTNAHVVLEQAPPQEREAAQAGRPWHVLCLSSAAEETLPELAAHYRDYLREHPDLALDDICFTANTGRSHLAHRLALVARSSSELAEQLDAAAKAPMVARSRGAAKTSRLKPVFLFTGQGAQYPGMGRSLYATQPTFRRTLERCDELLRSHLERPLLSVLYPEEGEASPLGQTAYTQPALFALEYALAETWRSWGVEPEAVMGHSVGEYVAACVAGVFSLEDGLRLIAERGRLMQALPPEGEMAAVFAGEAPVATALAPYTAEVSIAALNTAQNTVISGSRRGIQAVLKELAAAGIKAKRLEVSHAFHSPLMAPMTAEFAEIAREVEYGPPRIGLVSNLTGRLFEAGEVPDAEYWVRHVQAPVRFSAGLRALLERGCERFVEIGPDPTLSALGRRCAGELPCVFLPSLHRGRDEWRQMLESLGQLYVLGATIDWQSFAGEDRRRKVTLPTYPFQRQRYWLETSATRSYRPIRQSTGLHPLLGRRLRTAGKEVVFENEISARQPAYLDDHRVYGTAILPGTAYLEMALAAGAELSQKGEDPVLEDLRFEQAMALPADEVRTAQLILSPEDARTWSFEISSSSLDQSADEAVWVRHARGRLLLRRDATAPPSTDTPESLQAACSAELSVAQHYRRCEAGGIEFGPTFRGVERLFSSDGPDGALQALGRIRLPKELVVDAPAYHLHPALLDACHQVSLAAYGEQASEDALLLSGIERLRVFRRPELSVWSHARAHSGAEATVDVTIFNPTGEIVALVEGLQAKRVTREVLMGRREPIEDWLYEVQWRPRVRSGPASPVDYLPDLPALRDRLDSQMRELVAQAGLDSEEARGLLREFETLSLEYVVEAFRQMDWPFAIGQRFTTEEAARQLQVVDEHRRLFGRLLAILAEEGALRRTGEHWETLAKPETADPHDHWRALNVQHPAREGELKILGDCGSRLAEVLRGSRDPLELLFPSGGTGQIGTLYKDSGWLRVTNTLVLHVVTSAVERLPPGRGLRILEIGAGTGSTSSHLLPCLPAERTEYVFTDISPRFLTQAQETFAAYPFVRYELLDIERAPEAQGFGAHRYDIVVAANVLHATRDLRETLGHVQDLLAPGGLLILLEGTRPRRSVDLVFGMTNGWWRFEDEQLRPSHALLSASQWYALLEDCGFEEPGGVASEEQALILARGPEADPERSDDGPGRWMVLADARGVGERLASLMRSHGQASTLVFAADAWERVAPDIFRLDPTSEADFERLFEQVDPFTLRGVVHLWSLDTASADSLDAASLQAAAEKSCASTLRLVQCLAGARGDKPLRLSLVTLGAQPVGAEPGLPGLAQAPLWGMGKGIALEHPELSCLRIDLDPEGLEDAAAVLFEEIRPEKSLDELVEHEVAFRGGVRYVSRLARSGRVSEADGRNEIKTVEEGPYRLSLHSRGTLDNLYLDNAPRRPPAAGEIEIRTSFAGLNFNDVMDALGLLSFTREVLGGECAGQVTAIGPGVEGFEVGDTVVAIAPGAFAQYVTVAANLAARASGRLSLVEAATIPTAFATACYALHQVGRLRPGERVLIHAAAGGVGSAAVQLAQRVGARIVATASTGKWEFLKAQGIEHVMSSRTLDFAEEIMELTRGEGVDVVLNSLAGEFIPKSLSVLAHRGRFLEIGKSGIWSTRQVARIRPDVAYSVVDLIPVIQEKPEEIRSMLESMMEHFDDGSLRPLPYKVFPIQDALSAFRYMQQAKHIGKILLSCPEELESQRPIQFEDDATYLITGGLGGLGLAVADWMAQRGARHLVLLARRQPTPEARDELAKIEGRGARVVVRQADVSQRDQLASVWAEVAGSLPPLRGVVHCAGILADGVLRQQSWEHFVRVLEPKVQGAWNLHELTRDLDLEFFVLFSSVTSLFGSVAQANHSAANAFLDSLAYFRRARGLPGMSINWGLWSQTGAAAERRTGDRVRTRGLGTISTAAGLEAFERLLRRGLTQVGAVPVDWSQLLDQGAASPFFDDFKQASTAAQVRRSELLTRLKTAHAQERRSLLQAVVRDHVAKVLGLEKPELLDFRKGFFEMGMDSLTSVELRNRLQTDFGEEHPIASTLTFDHPSIEAVADYLAGQVLRLEVGERAAETSRQESAEPDGSELDEHTQEELAAMLDDRLYSILDD